MGFKRLYEEYLETERGLQALKLEGVHPDQLDVVKMSEKYFSGNMADMSIDMNANSNEEMNPNTYQAEVTKGVLKYEGLRVLHEALTKRNGTEEADRLMRLILDGYLYFHDASGAGIQMPYCFAYSTTNIMLQGRPYGQLHSLPPKRSDSFIAQVVETSMDLSQQFMGAIAPGDMIVNLAWFLQNEGVEPKSEEGTKYIENQFQKFIHVMNNKFRISGQSPFTNVSLFDRENLAKLFEDVRFPDGKKIDVEYTMEVQEVIMRFFSKGIPGKGTPYRFPVVTCNMSVDEDRNILDQQFLDLVADCNKDLGVFNIYVNEGSKVAMCCRYVNDFDRMSYRADSFGNGGMNIGSHRVVTINYPMLSLEAKGDKREFMHLLDNILEDTKELLLTHREILEERVEGGFLQFFKPLNWIDTEMLFSTIGIHGIPEMVKYMGLDITKEEGVQFVLDVLSYTDGKALEYSKETGHSFNTEEIPAEGAAVKLASKAKMQFPSVTEELFSNQYIPLTEDVSLWDRMGLTGKFMSLVSGGGILHLNVDSGIRTKAQMKKIIELAVEDGVEHFAINYGYGRCENGHTSIVGNGERCPQCGGAITDHLTRVIGYYTWVSSWGQVRREEEFPERKFKNLEIK